MEQQQCNQYTSPKKSKAIPAEVIISHNPHSPLLSSLTAAKDETIHARSDFPTCMIGNNFPFLPPCDLFICTLTINSCQEGLAHELGVKVLVIYFRQITKDDNSCGALMSREV